VSGNFANLDAGGIINGGALTITTATFSGNNASRIGGGIYNLNGGTVDIANTVLNAGDSGTNIFNSGDARVINAATAGNRHAE